MKIDQKSLITFLLISIFLTISGFSIANKKPTGILNIQSTPTGARVYLNGKLRGTTPMLLEMTAKSHELTLKYQGFETHTETVTVKKDKVTRKSIKLKKKSKGKPKVEVKQDIKVHKNDTTGEPGTVFLATTPKLLTAFVDGFEISKQTPVAFDIRPGIYELTLENSKKELVYKKTIFVRAGKTLTLDIIVQKKRTIDYTDPWK